MSPPNATIDPSQIIFPEASKSISSTLTNLKRTNLSIRNRLRSIEQDADFVQKVADAYQLPLIANERCGSWYIPPRQKAASAYFKSTDGHHSQWSFSLRRLNLQVVEVIASNGGCIIVDATRRGKSMPDALSKTVPIWIAVFNHILFPEHYDSHALKTPKDVVSRSEHAQIEERLSSFVADLHSLGLDLEKLRSRLRGKPLEPIWVTPDTALRSTPSIWMHGFRHVVVLCTASGQTRASDRALAGYVQGAADDSESWAYGLDASTFWAHVNDLLSTSEHDLPAAICKLIQETSANIEMVMPVIISPTPISIANNVAAEYLYSGYDFTVSCSVRPSETLDSKLKDRYLHLACNTGKVGSRQLREQLTKIQRLRFRLSPTSNILVTCPTGRDLAVGVALAIICCAFDNDGTVSSNTPSEEPSKQMTKQRLSWIMCAMPEAVPSRATLQSVNAFVLGGPIDHGR